MSQVAVPYLVLNYGCEMIFILEQRLSAQKVRPEKSARVLQDICKAVLAPSFVAELVAPQLMYTRAQTREIFDKLAHSSTMRLSENSMDKLYDLMTMACKYQVYACRVPRDLMHATLLHLEAVRKSVADTATTTEAIDSSIAAMRELSQSLTDGQLADARHALLNFFQGRRVKISLLMAERLQHKDGTFARGCVPAPKPDQLHCPILTVGTVQYFDSTGGIARTETIDHVQAKTSAVPFDNRLGRNLYTVDSKKSAASSSTPDGATSAAAGASSSSATASPTKAAPPAAPVLAPAPEKSTPVAPLGRRAFAATPSQGSSAAMSALSNLIVQNAPKDKGSVTIQNLFDDGGGLSATASSLGAQSSAGGYGDDVLHIGQVSREEMQRNNAKLMALMDDFDAPSPNRAPAAAPKGDAEDLLDLMDGM